jgi:uncharacterized repeat protein (TIGR01451 family)
MVGARSRPSGPGHGRRLVGALITVVLGASFALSTLPADTGAQGIEALDCSGNTIYQFQRASSGSTTGRLNTVNVVPMTPNYMGSVTATQVTTSLVPATDPGGNALGITEGGEGAWALAPQAPGGSGDNLNFTLRFFNTTTNAWTNRTVTIDTTNRLPDNVTTANIRSQGIVAGAVDPLSGNFYWAYLANAPRDRMVVFGYNTTTNQPIGVVAYSTLPQDVPTTGTTGSNGDIAFDGAGNLFVVSNTGTSAAVGVIQGPLPTSQQTPTPNLANTRLTLFPNPNNNSYNGIAFNGIGELFIQYSTGGTTTTIQKISPQNGATLAGPSQVNFSPTGGGIGVDLGGCAIPPTLELRKRVVARRADTDQFRLSITGGDLTGGNTATTDGPPTGVQTATAGPVLARDGTTYTFTETGAGTTNLANYGDGQWRCVDQAAGNSEVDSGTGRTFTFTPASGQAILCTFTNEYPATPNIEVVKTGELNTGADGAVGVGDIINYTIRVRNTGNVTLRNVTVTERDLAGLSAIVCPPDGTNVIPTLEPEDFEDCTATYALTQADIDRGHVPNFATATGTPPQGDDVTEGDDEQVPITAVPELNVVKTGRLDTGANGATNVGDIIRYTITVRNTGNVTLRNVRVTEEELEGLSPIDCPPDGTPVIPTLAVGQSVECTATYALTQDDLDAGYVPNLALATGTAPDGTDVKDDDDETVRITRRPELDVVKTGVLDTGANGATNVGDIIRYTITVRNTGNVTLRNVRVTERDLEGLSPIDCPPDGTNVIPILRVGQSVECTATYRVTQADIDRGYVPNYALATGTPPRAPDIPDAPAPDITDGDNHVEPIVGGLALRKTARPSVVTRGSTIRFRLRVTNTSLASVHGVRVCDRQPRGLAVASAPGLRVRGRTVCKFIRTLRPGHSRTLVFTARAGAGAPRRVTNISTATARNARSVRALARVRIVGRPPPVTG